MRYSGRDLINNLIEFKKLHNRYPKTKDFEEKKIIPTRKIFYKEFGNMEKAFKQAELFEKGELTLSQEEKTSCKPTKFECPICGSYLFRPLCYATLKDFIRMRFIELLKTNINIDYSNAVFDCFVSVFGKGNQEVEQALEKDGLLESYLMRLEQTKNDKVDKPVRMSI